MDPDPVAFRYFLDVYGTLPRAGPGGDEFTSAALELVPESSPRSALDLGCGPGAQTVALAMARPETHWLAVDLLPEMVDEAARRFAAANFGDRVRAVVGDMASPPVDAHSQDLIWCEAAIYNLGVTEALSAWRSVLRPGGSVVFSESVWLTESPPQEIREWWTAEYPAISDRAGVVARVEAASHRVIASSVLPPSAWWDDYYGPMEDRIAELRRRVPDDPIAADVAAAAEREIDMFRRFSDSYSYEFFVVQPVD